MDQDIPIYRDMDKVHEAIRRGGLVEAVESGAGKLK